MQRLGTQPERQNPPPSLQVRRAKDAAVDWLRPTRAGLLSLTLIGCVRMTGGGTEAAAVLAAKAVPGRKLCLEVYLHPYPA